MLLKFLMPQLLLLWLYFHEFVVLVLYLYMQRINKVNFVLKFMESSNLSYKYK